MVIIILVHYFCWPSTTTTTTTTTTTNPILSSLQNRIVRLDLLLRAPHPADVRDVVGHDGGEHGAKEQHRGRGEDRQEPLHAAPDGAMGFLVGNNTHLIRPLGFCSKIKIEIMKLAAFGASWTGDHGKIWRSGANMSNDCLFWGVMCFFGLRFHGWILHIAWLRAVDSVCPQVHVLWQMRGWKTRNRPFEALDILVQPMCLLAGSSSLSSVIT